MTLTGVFAPLPTPFDEDDAVDVIRLRASLKWWMSSPLAGFVVLGSNGEAVLMDDDECDCDGGGDDDRRAAARVGRCNSNLIH